MSTAFPRSYSPSRSLYIAFDVFPRPKGSSSHIASMVTALARDFAPVALLCLGDGELPVYQREGAIEIFRLPALHRDVLDRATAFAQFVEMHAGRLASSVERIVFRDPWGGLPAIRALPQVPAIFEVNALPNWELEYSRPGFSTSSPLGAKIGDLERECLRGASHVLTVSPVTSATLSGMGVPESSISTIRNSAAEVYFAANEPKTPDTMLYVGGLHAWQGVELLVDAFALAGLPAARLQIIHSGGRDTQALQRRIARHGLAARVTLRDPQPPDQLARSFSAARFTAAPLLETARNTCQGCCPVKIVESMAAGTAVLAADLAVCRDLIEPERTGILAAPNDARAWALQIRRLFLDPDLCDTLSHAARRAAREHFSQSNAHEELCAVFLRAARPGQAA